jgi:hypothetical protein
MAEEIKVGDTASAALPSCPCCTAERPHEGYGRLERRDRRMIAASGSKRQSFHVRVRAGLEK